MASVSETTKPAAESDARASCSDNPTRSVGTTESPGPSEIVSTTPDPDFTRVVAKGIWLATRSFGIRESCALVTVTT